MEATQRLFAAARIPALPGLQDACRAMAELDPGVRVCPSQDWHLTLKFLGGTTERQTALLTELLTNLGAEQPPLTIELRGLGVFPHLRRPTVIWAGLEAAGGLARLATQFEARCEPIGFPPEDRQWQPHLTLARLKNVAPVTLQPLLEQHAATDFGTVTIGELELIASTLHPAGPVYQTCARIPLRGEV